MNNNLTCKSCGELNPIYKLNCKKCSAYLRERVVNIDLFSIISNLIENPSKGFRNIIFAEHKNFIGFILFLASIKFFINLLFISLFTLGNTNVMQSLLVNYLITLGVLFFFSIAISFILKFILIIFEIETRAKDNVAALMFSFMPYAFAGILLYPIEIIVFGSSLFSLFPTPYEIKPFLAYVLTGFEAGIMLWSLFLMIIALKVQTRNWLFSVVFSIISHITLYFILYQLSFILYKP